jgi:hypothetical protein
MADESKEYDSDYESGATEGTETTGTLVDSERDYPIETRCCITGDEVKHSFCRYPDAVQGTMMVLSHEMMLHYSRKGQSLSVEFNRVLGLRRKQEKRRK